VTLLHGVSKSVGAVGIVAFINTTYSLLEYNTHTEKHNVTVAPPPFMIFVMLSLPVDVKQGFICEKFLS
jgi:hypothetical protein